MDIGRPESVHHVVLAPHAEDVRSRDGARVEVVGERVVCGGGPRAHAGRGDRGVVDCVGERAHERGDGQACDAGDVAARDDARLGLYVGRITGTALPCPTEPEVSCA